MRRLQTGRTKLAISAALVAALTGWYSIGDQARVAAAAPKDAPRHEKADQFDHHVAQCFILGNQNEVAAAKIAQKKGTSDDVKKFADTMIKDHEQFTADLEKFAGHNYRHRDADSKADGAKRTPAVEDKAARAGKDGDHHDHMAKMMRIHEELADQCRASVQRELDSKEGKSFDECYMGMQIGAHMKMVDELTVMARHVSPEFKSVLEKGLQTAQQHLDNAKKVMKNINDTRSADLKSTETK